MKILITGACGFIGSNFIRLLLEKRPDWNLVNLDKMTYAGDTGSLKEFESHPNYRLVKGDIIDKGTVEAVMTEGFDGVIHFAAESHVDRSIHGPEIFVETNVLGTQILLEAARKAKIKRFLHVSTDEVYGSLGATGLFSETTPLAPNSPYSASKTGSDLLVRAYFETYKMDAVITRCSNNYGPYQYPEKLIPLAITNLIDGKKIPVYGDGLNIRDWIHVVDHCRGVLLAFEKGKSGEVYNIGGSNEQRNIDIARMLLKLLGKDEKSLEFVEDRLGHDRRYAIDATKIKTELGWTPQHSFTEGLEQTVAWYQKNEAWWRPLRDKT